jgi:hypothetical protein
MAFATAGRVGGSAGSPSPVGELLEMWKWLSICGA